MIPRQDHYTQRCGENLNEQPCSLTSESSGKPADLRKMTGKQNGLVYRLQPACAGGWLSVHVFTGCMQPLSDGLTGQVRQMLFDSSDEMIHPAPSKALSRNFRAPTWHFFLLSLSSSSLAVVSPPSIPFLSHVQIFHKVVVEDHPNFESSPQIPSSPRHRTLVPATGTSKVVWGP